MQVVVEVKECNGPVVLVDVLVGLEALVVGVQVADLLHLQMEALT
jgi:hypothetical protein